MKVLFYLSLMLSFTACLSYKKAPNFFIDAGNIKQAQISQTNSLPIVLNQSQIDTLCKILNENKSTVAAKYINIYKLELTLNNDSSITIYTSKDKEFSYNESSKRYYALNGKTSFNDFWTAVGGNTAFYLFKPVIKRDESLVTSSNGNLDNEALKNLQQVLSYYKIEHKTIENQIYYKGTITTEENYNYMLKSQDTAWLESHKIE